MLTSAGNDKALITCIAKYWGYRILMTHFSVLVHVPEFLHQIRLLACLPAENCVVVIAANGTAVDRCWPACATRGQHGGAIPVHFPDLP